uniref:Uncharacterized protein n=1 Tax=Amphimedon queenslandica TaxID=400682 RepID=A0A1X7SXV8_AMPQE
MADFWRERQAKQSSLLSIHSSCGSHFELSFCFSILYLSLLNILNHWPFPLSLNPSGQGWLL